MSVAAYSGTFEILYTPDRRQSKTLTLWTNIDQKYIKMYFLIGDWQQMTNKNTVSSDFLSAFVDC